MLLLPYLLSKEREKKKRGYTFIHWAAREYFHCQGAESGGLGENKKFGQISFSFYFVFWTGQLIWHELYSRRNLCAWVFCPRKPGRFFLIPSCSICRLDVACTLIYYDLYETNFVLRRLLRCRIRDFRYTMLDHGRWAHAQQQGTRRRMQVHRPIITRYVVWEKYISHLFPVFMQGVNSRHARLCFTKT